MCPGNLGSLLGGIAACKYYNLNHELKYLVKGFLVIHIWGLGRVIIEVAQTKNQNSVGQNSWLACTESLDLEFQPRSLHICPNQIFQPDDDHGGDDAEDDDGDDSGGGDDDDDDQRQSRLQNADPFHHHCVTKSVLCC